MTSGQENLSLEGRCQIFAPRGLLCALATTSLFKKAASPLSRRWDDAEIADLAECSGSRGLPGSRASTIAARHLLRLPRLRISGLRLSALRLSRLRRSVLGLFALRLSGLWRSELRLSSLRLSDLWISALPIT